MPTPDDYGSVRVIRHETLGHVTITFRALDEVARHIEAKLRPVPRGRYYKRSELLEVLGLFVAALLVIFLPGRQIGHPTCLAV